MPWTRIENLTTVIPGVESVTTINVGDGSSHVAVVRDIEQNERFVINWVFPADRLQNNYFYAPASIDGISIDSFALAGNTIIMNCTKLNDTFSINTLRMGFPLDGASYDEAASEQFSIIVT